MPSREVNAFMRDFDVNSLPDIREAKALQRQRKIDGLEADRATVRDEIQWQEALDKAAIAKEEKQRQFVEPKTNANEKPAAERNLTQPGRREERGWSIQPPQRQSSPGFEKVRNGPTRDDRTDMKDFSRIIPAAAKDGIRASFKVASSALGGIGAGVHAFADGFDSLFSPKLTPEQIREGEITQQRREADADASIDYSRYTAEATQQRRQQENDREAERHRQRDGGGGER